MPIFSWAPLKPPNSDAGALKCASRLSDFGAFTFLGLGIIQVALGLQEGPLRFVPLAIGILFFGLPHGAIDHLVALGLADKPLRLLPLISTLFLYLLAVFGVLALWAYFPVMAAFGFLIMTMYHWGKSDLAFERYVLFIAPKFRGELAMLNHAIVRGMIPICIPFLAFPDQAIEFLVACIRLFSEEYVISFQELRFWIFPIFGVSFLMDQWVHVRKVFILDARRICIENILLVAYFWFIPPLIAIGCYFAGWHGLRHIIRLCHYERKGAKSDPVIAGKIRTFALQAFPFTVISVFMLCGLIGGLADRVLGAYEGVALYLVLISALTFPHLIIVEWMDYREGMLRNV